MPFRRSIELIKSVLLSPLPIHTIRLWDRLVRKLQLVLALIPSATINGMVFRTS